MLQTGIELRKKLQVMRVFVVNPKDDTFNDRQNEQDCACLGWPTRGFFFQ